MRKKSWGLTKLWLQSLPSECAQPAPIGARIECYSEMQNPRSEARKSWHLMGYIPKTKRMDMMWGANPMSIRLNLEWWKVGNEKRCRKEKMWSTASRGDVAKGIVCDGIVIVSSQKSSSGDKWVPRHSSVSSTSHSSLMVVPSLRQGSWGNCVKNWKLIAARWTLSGYNPITP